ncbi:MAG: hypothetical protein KBS81_09595 [Spirochaetales bacterium]|nr:hypothetical protein [Candidatus Physcosoma equi]
MVKDIISNLDKYYSLDERLKHLMTYKEDTVGKYAEFKIDRETTEIFVVERGQASFATSWRENRENHEVTAVMTAQEGEFVIYLPGEPIAVTPAEGALVLRRKLK